MKGSTMVGHSMLLVNSSLPSHSCSSRNFYLVCRPKSDQTPKRCRVLTERLGRKVAFVAPTAVFVPIIV